MIVGNTHTHAISAYHH